MAFRFRSIFSATPKLHSSKRKSTRSLYLRYVLRSVPTRVRAKAFGARISMEEEEAAPAFGPGTPLSTVADAFERLTAELNTKEYCNVKLKPFCEACSLVSVLFGCLGIAFKFAELEYVAKVQSLTEASSRYETLESILDHDVENKSVKTAGSLSRNLRRVRQGLHLMKDIFQNFLSSCDSSLKDAASNAYAKVCAPYHTWAVRTAVCAGMYALPTRDQLLERMKENDVSAEQEMKRYIKALNPIIDYIDNLYISRNITLDW